MASRQQLRSLTEEVICPICLDFFRDPVSLECGHNFCRSCITQCWENGQRHSCPECRSEFPEISLRVNWALSSLAEKARTLNLEPQKEECKLQCEHHQEDLKLFCVTEKKLSCLICRDSRQHALHKFLPIKEAVEVYKNRLKSSIDSLTEKKSAVLETELTQKRKISEVREQASSLQTHITSQFTQMYQILTEKEQRLLRDLREEEERIVESMEKNLQDIRLKLSSIEVKLSKLQKQMEEQDELIFLKMSLLWDSYQSPKGADQTGIRDRSSMGNGMRLPSVQGQPLPPAMEEHPGQPPIEEACQKKSIKEEYQPLSVRNTTLSTGKFNGPLQYTVWREMMDIISPVPASLTLDPNTANPCLVLSQDRTRAQLGDKPTELPRKVTQFDQCTCVLGLEGFTSGRHYWEVEVGDKTEWGLGVARESVERKGGIDPRPETGYWVVWLIPGSGYLAGTYPSWIRLSTNVNPWKMGVFLDYEGGQVSFYNADTMSHLHTFTHTFTERIFPFFHLGSNDDRKNSAPLTICGIKGH